MEEKKEEQEITSASLRGLVKGIVGKLGPKFSKEQKIAYAKLLIKIFEQGVMPKEAMKISDKEVSEIYSFAYQLFHSGQYTQALEMFKMLVMIEPAESGFAVALGACYHKLQDYENALRCYFLGSALAPNDPVPLFYAYGCYMQQQNKVAAGLMLSNVLVRAATDEKYAQIKAQAQLLLEGLKEQFAEEQKIKI